MRGNSHVRFLEEGAAVTPLPLLGADDPVNKVDQTGREWVEDFLFSIYRALANGVAVEVCIGRLLAAADLAEGDAVGHQAAAYRYFARMEEWQQKALKQEDLSIKASYESTAALFGQLGEQEERSAVKCLFAAETFREYALLLSTEPTN